MPGVRLDCGVKIDGRRPKSKKEIRETLADSVLRSSVSFDVTSAFGEHAGRTFYFEDLPTNCTVTFVGPDPYANRKFYGTLDVTHHNGELIAHKIK